MLIVAGVGPGNPRYLTLDVKERIEKFRKVLAFSRIRESLGSIRPDIIKIDTVAEVVSNVGDEQEVLLLASGDPNFFGIVEYLKKSGITIHRILPGLSSFQYMMAKLQKPWQGAKFFSLHGRKECLRSMVQEKLGIALVDRVNTPDLISKSLYSMGMRGRLYVGFNLSYRDEMILEAKIGDEIENISPLGVVVIENEMD